jgi:hypothetical protein
MATQRIRASSVSIAAMGLFIFGTVLLTSVIGLFYLKDEMRIAWLARLAYSEFIMRLAVLAVALMFIGALLMASQFFTAS